MTDQKWSFNSKSYPIPSVSIDPTPVLQLADPVLFQLASFFTQILNSNLLPRFQEEANACGLKHANLDNWIDGYGVAQTVVFPFEDNPTLLKTTDFKFPLMSIYPIGEDLTQFTLTKLSTRREIGIAWILPPMTPGQYNRMYPFFSVAIKTLLTYGNQGYDPKVSTTNIWKTAGLSFGSITDAEYVPMEGLASTPGSKEMVQAVFPCIRMRVMFWERNQDPVPANFVPFTGISVLQENLVDGYNPANPIVNFIDGYVLPDITITSCTPSSGSIQGNTLLVIQGTGFDANKLPNASQLTVCGVAVKQLVVKSPTAIMAITNPGITTGSGNIVITDLAGNSYQLTNGFTYV